MLDRTDTEASQKAPAVLRMAAHPFNTTLEYHSISSCEIVSSSSSSERGDSPPVISQANKSGHRPKVSRASRLHTFSSEELDSILLHVSQTLQTPIHPQGTSFAHARTGPRPDLTMGQGDQGSPGNPTLLPSFTGGLGTVSTHVQGSVNPRDTLVRTQRIDGDDSSDSWSRYQPTTDAEIKKYDAFKRAFQAHKEQQVKQQQ